MGPSYPTAFRAVVLLAPQLKQRLEVAIRAGRAKGGAAITSAGAGAHMAASAAPKIQLKMDFSNFSA